MHSAVYLQNKISKERNKRSFFLNRKTKAAEIQLLFILFRTINPFECNY